jgi:NADPH:quinone reductase
MASPATALTAVIDAPGGPEAIRFEERPLPSPGPGEVTIRHTAAGLNFIDIYQRSGLYPLPMPLALGMEGAGVITAVGAGVTHLSVGQRAAYAANPPGSFATARTMKAAQVCPLPDGVSDQQGAALLLKGMTTHYLFRRTVPLPAGSTVLFHAAAGGVGLIACQWARASGIRLIATAGSDEKCALALAHGADAAVNYRTTDWVRAVRDLTDGRGVDAVMDGVGKDTFDGSLDCLRPLGMMISFGNASGPVPPFNIATLGAKGSLQLTRPTLFTHIADGPTCQQMAAEVFQLVTSGAVTVRIDQTWPLLQVGAAQEALAARATTGATVLTMG